MGWPCLGQVGGQGDRGSGCSPSPDHQANSRVSAVVVARLAFLKGAVLPGPPHKLPWLSPLRSRTQTAKGKGLEQATPLLAPWLSNPLPILPPQGDHAVPNLFRDPPGPEKSQACPHLFPSRSVSHSSPGFPGPSALPPPCLTLLWVLLAIFSQGQLPNNPGATGCA